MTEITPNPLENTRFSDFAILLFYDHPAKAGDFVWVESCPKIKVFAGLFQKAAGVSGAAPTSRDRSRGISPERAEQARSGIMRSETQEGEPEISPVDCFGPGEPSSGVPPARRLWRLVARKRVRGKPRRGFLRFAEQGEANEALFFLLLALRRTALRVLQMRLTLAFFTRLWYTGIMKV